MSYDPQNPSSYLGDGVYWDWENASYEETYEYDLDNPDVTFSYDECEIKKNKRIEKQKNILKQKEIQNEKIFLADEKRRQAREVLIKNNLFNLSRNCKSVHDFKELIFKKVVLKKMRMIAKQYCIFEKLPIDYAEVALQRGVLSEVILSHLNKLSIYLDYPEEISVRRFSNKISKNDEGYIVYDRVGRIQSLLHNIIAVKFGSGSEFKVDKEIMRRILSFSRLYLSIYDMKNKKISDFMQELSTVQIRRDETEIYLPEYVRRSKKNFIKKWKFRHLKTILFYADRKHRKFFSKLLIIDDNSSFEYSIEVLSKVWPQNELP